MTPEDEDRFRALIREETRPCQAPAPPPEPKNGHLTRWLGVVGAGLAVIAVAGALATWRDLGVVEEQQRSVDARQLALEAVVAEIRGDTKAMRSQFDQLLGRLGAREP